MRLFGLIFTCFPLLFIAVGGWLAFGQQRKLLTYQPIDAIVISAQVESRSSSDGTTYAPQVNYEYVVDNQTYTSDRALTMNYATSSRSWAQGIVDRFEPNTTVTAYVDPADPSSAFLVREPTFFPYVFLLFPMVFVCVGIAVMTQGGSAVPAASLEQTEPGWYRLRPTGSIRGKARSAMLVAMLWWGMGAAVLVHWVFVGGGASTFAAIALSVFALLGFIPLGYLWQVKRVGRRFGDAMVLVDQPTPKRGDTIAIYYEQPIYEHVELRDVRIALQLKWTYSSGSGKHRSTRTEVIYDDEQVVSQGELTTAGDALRFERTATIPSDRPATEKRFMSMKHNWVIHIKTDAINGADYEGDFPIKVLS